MAGRAGLVAFSQLARLFQQHVFPLLSVDRQRTVRGHLDLLERHLTRDCVVDELSQHDVDAYAAAYAAAM